MTYELNTLYCADCLPAMREMPDNAFELAIVDPPYGIKINHSIGRRRGQAPSGHAKIAWDDEPPTAEYFKELFRVSRNQIVWGANHFISRMPFDSPCWICWDKRFSNDVSFAAFELAWTSFSSTSKKFEFCNIVQGKVHPTQKPVDLYRWLLSRYAHTGDKILDTHVGSGSSLIACIEHGYDFVGFEIDPGYHAKAQARIDACMAQGRLEL